MRGIRNARSKAAGKEFYKKMLAAKQAKADKVKREKGLPLDVPKPKPDMFTDIPKKDRKRLEVTEDVPMSKMEQHTDSQSVLEAALNRLEQQSRGL